MKYFVVFISVLVVPYCLVAMDTKDTSKSPLQVHVEVISRRQNSPVAHGIKCVITVARLDGTIADVVDSFKKLFNIVSNDFIVRAPAAFIAYPEALWNFFRILPHSRNSVTDLYISDQSVHPNPLSQGMRVTEIFPLKIIFE